MKPAILVTREVFDETLEFLAVHCEVDSNQADVALDPAKLAERLSDKEGIMCALTDRIDDALLARCPKLKVVANIAVGFNNIDLAACTARGIMATNTPGVLDDSTADLAWALMLGAARRLTELERRVRGGEWTGWRLKQWLGVDVHHATLGIFGMGRIGQAIARRAAGFEMKVLYHNRTRVAPELEKRLNATFVARDELLRQSDFLVLQDVDRFERHFQMVENRHCPARKAALREERAAFHEQHDVVVFHHRVDPVLNVTHLDSPLGTAVSSCSA